MNRIALLLVLSLCCFVPALVHAQIFYSENFNAGPGTWNPVSQNFPGTGSGTNANAWLINNPTTFSINNNNCLHISDPTLPLQVNYNDATPANLTDVISFSNVITTPATGNIILRCKWMCLASAASEGDSAAAYYRLSPAAPWVHLPGNASMNGSGIVNNFVDTLPATANGINSLQIGFRWYNNGDNLSADPGILIDDVSLETYFPPNTITTGTLPATSFCAGDNLQVPFTTTGTYNVGNIFTVQLSDATGSFTTPVNIGNGTTNPINCVIPAGTAPGTGYLIRVVSSAPATTGSNSAVFTINASQTIILNFTQTADSVCSGGSVTFTASSAQPLTNQVWSWSVNGVNQSGQTLPTFTLTNITLQSTVVVTLTTTDPCVSNPTVQATGVVNIKGSALSVAVNTTSNDTICPTQSITFGAATNLVLTNATYTWFVNGTQVQTGASPNYTTTTLTGLNAITVAVSSTDPCLLNSAASSAPLNILAQAQPLVHNISVFPNNNPCQGSSITFTSNVTPLPPDASYQWFVNGVQVPGQVNATFTTTNYPNNAQVTCAVSTTNACYSGSPQNSNIISITYSSGPPATVSLSADTTAICQGNPVVFTTDATNQGIAPAFRWFVNGQQITGAADSALTSTSLPFGQTRVVVELTSSEICSTQPVATDTILIDVTERVVPTISILTLTPFCSNTPGTLNAISSIPGGIITWMMNNDTLPIRSGGLTMSNIPNPSVFSAFVTNLAGCITNSSATSAPVTINVFPSPTVNAGTDQTIIYGRSAQLNAEVTPSSGQYTYFWTPSNTLSLGNIKNPVAKPLDTLNRYVVQVRNLSGCIASDTVNVRVTLNYEVFVPSAFSPNGDSNNDVLYVRSADNQIKEGQFTFRIFDEFGELLFESFSKQYGWDGTFKDKNVIPGIYVYHCFGIFNDNKTFDVSGKVILMR